MMRFGSPEHVRKLREMTSGVRSIPYAAPTCASCEKPAERNGFCAECADEIERDIAMQDILPTRSKRSLMDARVREDDARIRQKVGRSE